MLEGMFVVLTVAAFASFLSSVFLVFRTPDGTGSALLTGLKVASIATWVVALICIARPAPGHEIAKSVALAGQSCALALYWMAAMSVPAFRLTIAFSPQAPPSIQSDGPFRWLLHPFYTAYVLSYWSCFLYSLRWQMGVAAAALHVLYAMSARGEERTLLASFGDRYAIAQRTRFSPFPRLRG